MRVIFFGELKNYKVDFRYLKKSTAFRFLNYDMIKKLKFNGFLINNNSPTLTLTYKGCVSFICLLGQIIKEFDEDPSKNQDISKRLYSEGFSFGGFKRDYAIHEKILNSLFQNLVDIGFLKKTDSSYAISDEASKVKTCLNLVSAFVSNAIINRKEELLGLINVLKIAANLTDFSIGVVMKQSPIDLQGKIKNLLSRIDYQEHPLMPLIRKKATESIGSKDWLTSAAFWALEASLHEERKDEKWSDYCKSRGYISLAIAYKRNENYEEAGRFYEKAAEILQKNPDTAKKATVQSANALQCKAKHASSEENFLDAASYYSKASTLFKTVQMNNESAFCQYRNLESQAIELSSKGEFLASAKLFENASDIIKTCNKKHYFSALAKSWLSKKDHARKMDDVEQITECYKQAAEEFKKAGNQKFYCRYMGNAIQNEAISMVASGISYTEIAEKFKSASDCYAQSLDLEASTVCQADSLKYLALKHKNNGKLNQAIEFFKEAKTINQDLAFNCPNPLASKKYRDGVIWFEAMIVETTAQNLLLTKIPKKEKLGEVSQLLTRAADLFSRVNDYKHALISSTFIMVTMAIDAFHEGDAKTASSLIKEAKSRLPSDFVFSMFETDVKTGWHPLRYTMSMLKDFNRYARQVETEKGFSFESRVRELFRKKYQQYQNIESKVLSPEEEEIGIVFEDNTPIEIDAIGTYTIENRNHILIAEIKNITKDVGKDEIIKFLKKINFIEKRYATIARLQSLHKPIIDKKLFVSASDFDSSAVSIAEKNDIQLMRKQEIRDLMRKFQIYPIPNE